MIATVTNQGKTRWMIIDEAFNSDKLIEFMQALIKESQGKKIFPDSGQPEGAPQQASQGVGDPAQKRTLSCSTCPAIAPNSTQRSG